MTRSHMCDSSDVDRMLVETISPSNLMSIGIDIAKQLLIVLPESKLQIVVTIAETVVSDSTHAHVLADAYSIADEYATEHEFDENESVYYASLAISWLVADRSYCTVRESISHVIFYALKSGVLDLDMLAKLVPLRD